MADYEYRVVPFIGQGRGGEFKAEEIATQLQALIGQNARDGWEFYRIDQIQINVPPGCLPSLLGAKSVVTSFDMATFRHERG